MSDTYTITYKKSGHSAKAPHMMNLLEFTDTQGEVRIPALCRGGSCGTCKVRVISGEVELETVKALRPGEKEAGLILACSSRILSDLVLDV